MTSGPFVSRLSRWVAVTLALVLPTLILAGFYSRFYQTDLGDLVPYAHWDTYDYYLEINAFARGGLDMGRFTLNEVPPPVASSPFGPHAPYYPMALGLMARCLGGLPTNAAPFLNLAFFTACLALFIRLTRPSLGYLAFAAAVACFIPDFPHAGATYWQDTLHYGLSFLLAGLFHGLIHAPDASRRARMSLALLCVLILASAFRTSWAILLPAWGLAAFPATRRGRILGLVTGAGFFLAMFLAYLLPASPFVDFANPGRKIVTEALSNRAGVAQTLGHFASVLTSNARLLAADIGANFFIAFTILLLPVGLVAILLRRQSLQNTSGSRRVPGDLAWVHAICLGGTLAAGLFYQIVEIRHLYPAYFVSLLLLGRSLGAGPLFALFLGAQIASSLLTMQSVQTRSFPLAVGHQARLERVERFRSFIGPFIPFVPHANSWCNTLLVADFETITEHLGLTPGIGLSYVMSYTTYQPPAKSRYLLVKNDWQSQYFQATNHLVPLARTTAGDLFLNRDCSCAGLENPEILPALQTDRLVAQVLDIPLSKDSPVHARDLADCPYASRLDWRALTLPGGTTVLEAVLTLDPGATFRLQAMGGGLTEQQAETLAKRIDALELLVTFTRFGQDAFLPSDTRLYVHCASGRFRAYNLAPADAVGATKGVALPVFPLTYNDLELFLCDYW